jgi:hypothetical protein
MFNSTLFRRNEEKFIKSPGIWTCQLKYRGNVFIAKKFLVLPSHPTFEKKNLDVVHMWEKNIKTFWRHTSICVKSIENQSFKKSYFHSKLFSSCFDSSKWSTFYPDPKSNLEDNFGMDFKSRKLIF